MVRLQTLAVEEVRHVAHTLAREMMTWDEPIPEFQTRFPNILESCLMTPFQKFSGKEPYPRFVDKAAVLFYLMIKNHPFKNGNKRIAVTTLLVFLAKNNRWIRVDNQELYNFARWVASSNPKLRKSTIQAIRDFITLYMVKV